MPDHFHLLITPSTSLERAVQFIKGGFSYRAKKELGSNMEIWQRGFSDHRIRDAMDLDLHIHYIHLNPVKKHLRESPDAYPYSSAYAAWKLDPIPQWLKPLSQNDLSGTAEAVPFQNVIDRDHSRNGTGNPKPPQRAEIPAFSNKREHQS